MAKLTAPLGVEMTHKRKVNILRTLALGGVLNKNGDRYRLHNPLGIKPVKPEEALELLADGYLVPISWGVVGFVWALRTDFISIYKKRLNQ